jgi:NTP pyrophosphatase (non-canonical NTP hydrolase)
MKKNAITERPITLTFDEYQDTSHETAIYKPVHLINESTHSKEFTKLSWVYPALGLSAEVGELENVLKKIIRDDDGLITQEKEDRIIDELGDILWYVAEIATLFDIRLSYIAIQNMKKLKERVKNGTVKGR